MNGFLFKIFLMGGLILGQTIAGGDSALAQKELCRFVKEEQKSAVDRPIVLNQFGLKVNIPSNYRAVLLNNGRVEIVTPGTFDFLTCLRNGGVSPREVTYGYYNIRLIPNPKSESVLTLARRSLPQSKTKYFTYTLQGTPVVILETVSGEIVGAYFNVQGIDGIVEISAHCNCQLTAQDVTLVLDQTFLLQTSNSINN
jgi:hypothetical protein